MSPLEMTDLTPEHTSRSMNGLSHPEIRAAFRYVHSVISTADVRSPVGGYAWHGWALREAFLAGCTRASTQLAQPEREGLTDEELLAVLDKATADFPPLHPEARALNAVEYPLALELRKARAVEAAVLITPDDFRRWWRETGSASPAPSPEMLLTANAWAQYCLDRWGHSTPQPPADGEVAELVEWLRGECASEKADGNWVRMSVDRALDVASLLQRQHPQPVPVAERLPGPEDCLDEGWAWFFSPRVGWRQAVLPVSPAYTHWLPAHALPLPTIEEFTS